MAEFREWKAVCRDACYSGGEWPIDRLLQWDIEGVDEPPGRGMFYQDDAYLVAAAPNLYRELLHLVRLMEPLEDGGLNIPGLATLNGARAALAKAEGKG